MTSQQPMSDAGIAEHFRAVSALLANHAALGGAPWMRSFDGLQTPLPVGYATERRVRDSACVWLAAVAAERGYRDPRWCTVETVRARGGRTPPLRQATTVVHWMPMPGAPEYEAVPYRVFNAQQCAGLREWLPESYAPRWQEERARRILRVSGAAIEHSPGIRAHYDPDRDRIALPPEESFPDPDAYLRTALDQLVRWTGHPDRLRRGTLALGTAAGHGSREHAREELRVAIASMMLGDRLEFGHDRPPPLAQHWIEILREDPLEIDRASREAQRICDGLIALDRGRPPPWGAAGQELLRREPPQSGRDEPSR